MLKKIVFISSFVAVFIPECQVYGDSTKIDISSCDGQMETGAVFSVNYTAINAHCNCTIFPRHNGSLKFASKAIKENCYTEITILELQQAELNSLITIPCQGPRQTPTFTVTQDSVLYMTSRSVNTTTEPERFYQEIRIFGITGMYSSLNASISVTCGSTLQSSSAKPSDVTTTENGYTSTTSAEDSLFVAVGSGIVVIAVIIVIIFCKRGRNQEKGTNKSDKLLSGGNHNVTNGNNEYPNNSLYHSYNYNADGGYSTVEDVNGTSCDELPDNPMYHSYEENIKASGAADMVEEKTGKEDIPMLETGSNAIYAQPNKVPKRPKSKVENITLTENVYAEVKKPDKQ